MKKIIFLFGILCLMFILIDKTKDQSFASNHLGSPYCNENPTLYDCWCSGDGASCIPIPTPVCRTESILPRGLYPDPSTEQQCPTGQQPTSQITYEVCDAGCGEYIRSYGLVCEPIATPAPPLISSPNPSIAPSSSPCREVFVSSPGPGGQQIQIKSLDCSPQPQ